MHSVYYLVTYFQGLTKIFRNRNIPQHPANVKKKKRKTRTKPKKSIQKL